MPPVATPDHDECRPLVGRAVRGRRRALCVYDGVAARAATAASAGHRRPAGRGRQDPPAADDRDHARGRGQETAASEHRDVPRHRDLREPEGGGTQAAGHGRGIHAQLRGHRSPGGRQGGPRRPPQGELFHRPQGDRSGHHPDQPAAQTRRALAHPGEPAAPERGGAAAFRRPLQGHAGGPGDPRFAPGLGAARRGGAGVWDPGRAAALRLGARAAQAHRAVPAPGCAPDRGRAAQSA